MQSGLIGFVEIQAHLSSQSCLAPVNSGSLHKRPVLLLQGRKGWPIESFRLRHVSGASKDE